MDSNIKKYITNDMSGNSCEALNAAVKAIYFADNSDYESALWEVVIALLDGLVPDDADDTFISELAGFLNPDWNS